MNAPCALLAVLLSPALAAQNSFATIGGGSTPSGVSADGSVVVGTDALQYFVWTPSGGKQTIGGTAPGNGIGGTAQVSDDGLALVGTYLNPASNLHELSRYSLASSSWTPLGGIGGFSGSETSSGWGISDDGQTLVGLGWVTAGSAHAIRYTPALGLVDLGSTVPNRSSRANATNGDGTVVVGWQDQATGFRQGAVWINGVQQLITASGSGAALGEAGDVTPDGQWVVGLGVSSNGFQPWRWSAAGGAQSLGILPGSNLRSGATAISDDGRRVIGYARPFSSPAAFGEGFLWIEGIGMLNLTSVMNQIGAGVPAGYTLALPLAMSGDGNTIVGVGRQGAATSGFVLHIGALQAQPLALSSAAGGTQQLALRAGAAHAGELYFVLGSATGTSPGIAIDALTLPLVLDGYTQSTLALANSAVFGSTLGFLDGSGAGAAAIHLPAGLGGLAGANLNHAFVVFDLPGLGAASFTSNAALLQLVP